MHPQATVDRARLLSRQGLIDREVARITGVSIGAVQKWRTERRRARGTQRAQVCPRCEGRELDEPAYLYLLGLYLGDGWLTREHRHVFALSIACSNTWPGLLIAAKSAMSAVMPTSSVFSARRVGMTEVKSTSRHWPCLFPQHGPGPKHTPDRRKSRLSLAAAILPLCTVPKFACGLWLLWTAGGPSARSAWPPASAALRCATGAIIRRRHSDHEPPVPAAVSLPACRSRALTMPTCWVCTSVTAVSPLGAIPLRAYGS